MFMGLSIKDIISRKEVNFEDLRGKTVCVDAFNILYQFLSTIRQADGTPLKDNEGQITSHLSGILYRNIFLLNLGLKLIYVFDGEPPQLKRKIHKKRTEQREIAEEKYEEAKSTENLEDMRKFSQRLVRLENNMIEESKELLHAMGIATVQAPGEGESEAAYLARREDIYASVSQDYDSLSFGAPILIRNLTISRKKKTSSGYVEVYPEVIVLEEVLKELEINQDQLICLGILVGTDYNPKGVFRIGQKKALEIVKEFVTPEEIFKSVENKIAAMNEEDQFDWKEVFALFRAPQLRDSEIIFPKIDTEKIKEILVHRHGFNSERINNQLEKLEKVKKAKTQKALDKWF